jgi:hypothetical protein
MTPTLTLTQLKALDPCQDSLKRVARFLGDVPLTASEARAAGATFKEMAWAAAAVASIDRDVRRRRRLWGADCAAHVLHLFERKRPTDQRARRAIETGRAYARGEIGVSAILAVREAAGTAAAHSLGSAAWSADRAAYAAAWCSAESTTHAALEAASWAGAEAGFDGIGEAGRAAASDAEAAWQFDRLVAWLSDPEPEDWPLPPRPCSGAPVL